MKLSIIIPAYDVERYVGKMLESVFDTTASVEDFEVIVVNDGSRDGTMEVVRHYSDRPNLTILEQKNQGVSAARMNGLFSAKGDFVWFVDSDDYLVEDGVGKVMNLLMKMPEVQALMFPIKRVYDDSSLDYSDIKCDSVFSVDGKTSISTMKLPTAPSVRFVLRRSLMENKWLFFPLGLIHEDEYFGPVLLTLVDRITVVPDYVYIHIKRPGSIMNSLTVRSSFDTVSVYRLLIMYMENSMASSDWFWFREYCMGRLLESYIRCPQFYGTSAFNRFIRANGLYIWKQWCITNPQTTVSKRIRKLCFFMMPRLSQKLIKLRGQMARVR